MDQTWVRAGLHTKKRADVAPLVPADATIYVLTFQYRGRLSMSDIKPLASR